MHISILVNSNYKFHFIIVKVGGAVFLAIVLAFSYPSVRKIKCVILCPRPRGRTGTTRQLE